MSRRTKYASFVKRAFAWLVDKVITGILAMIVTFPLAIILLPGVLFTSMKLSDVGMLSGNVFLAVGWLYFAFFESSPLQATPGKLVLGVFVTDDNGNRIGFFRAFLRSVMKTVSGMIFFLGYILALVSPRNRALHDYVAGTLVLEPDFSLEETVVFESEYTILDQ